MRHLELPVVRLDDEDDIKTECDIVIKDEDLECLDIKDEFIGLGAFDEALQSVVDFHTYDKKDLVGVQTIAEDESRLCQNIDGSSISLPDNNRHQVNKEQKKIEENDIDKVDKSSDDKSVDDEWKSHWGIKCSQCEQTWTSKAAFDEHYRSSYGLTPAYTCSYCDKTTDKYSTFRSHCYRHAMEGRHRCMECGKGFSIRSMLTAHLQAKHAHIKPFMCELCGRAFATRGGFRAHQQRRHSDGAPSQSSEFPCGECGKVLRTRGGLTAHLAVHRLGRRFMCDLCGKTFTQKVNMQQHVRQHAGDRPWSCDICGKAFAERSHLARHQQFHSNVRPWRCDICGRTYKTERCLKVHGLVHAERRPHSCHTCGKGFLSTTKLRQHVNVHTGERPYKCQYCERAFTNYPNWLKHTRRRHASEADKTRAEHKSEEQCQSYERVVTEPVIALPPFALHFDTQQLQQLHVNL